MTNFRALMHRARSVRAVAAGLVLFFASGAFAQSAAAPRKLRDVVSSDALLYIDVPDFQASLKRAKEIALAKILREEEFQTFLEPVWGMVREKIDESLTSLGEKAENWQSCPFNAMEIVVSRLDANGPLALVVRADVGKTTEIFRRLLPAQGGPANREDVDGDIFLDTELGPNVGAALSGNLLYFVGVLPDAPLSGREAAKAILKRVKGGSVKSSLAEDPRLVALTAKFQGKSPEWTAFVRPAPSFEAIRAIIAQNAGVTEASAKARPRNAHDVKSALDIASAVAAELGVSDVAAVAICESYTAGGAVVTETVIANDGEPKGLTAFLGATTPIDKSLLDRAYDGVDSFAVSSIEPMALYDGLYKSLTRVGEILGPAAERNFPALKLLAQYEKEHNIKIGDDFFGSLGSTIYSYSFPPKAGSAMPMPESFVGLRLKDKAKFEASLKKLVTSAESVPGVKVEISEGTAARPAVYTVRYEPDAGSMRAGPAMQLSMVFQQVALCVAVMDEWVLFGTNPVAMKNELRKLSKPRDVSAEIKKLFAEVPAGATAFTYHDWRPTIRTVWDTLASFASLAAGQADELPVNLQEIPTSQSIVKHIRPTYGYTVATKNLTYSKSVGSFGLEVIGGFAAGGTAAAFASMAAANPSGPLAFELDQEETMVASAEPTTPGKDPVATTRATIRIVEVGIQVYKAEKGECPETLDILLKPTDDYPEGYLVGMKSVPLDAWGRALVYKRSADRATFKLRSCGPNGKDDGGEGDDVR